MQGNLPTLGIFAVTPEGGAKAYRDVCMAFYKSLGSYQNPTTVLYTQPLIGHVENFGNKKIWHDIVQSGIDFLLNSGAKIIWMPANSSHLIIDEVRTGDATFVNMVDQSIASLKQDKRKTLVLGTNVSMSDQLYFKDKAGLDHCLIVEKEEQERVHNIILNELILGSISVASREFFKTLIEQYRKEKGVERVFFACTELPCFFKPNDFSISMDDSISVSIRSIVDLYKKFTEGKVQ